MAKSRLKDVGQDTPKLTMLQLLNLLSVEHAWKVLTAAVGIICALFSAGYYFGHQFATSEAADKRIESSEKLSTAQKENSDLREQVKNLERSKTLEIEAATDELKASLARIALGANVDDSLDVRTLVASRIDELDIRSKEYAPDGFWAMPKDSVTWKYDETALSKLEQKVFQPIERGNAGPTVYEGLLKTIITDLQSIPTGRVHSWTLAEPNGKDSPPTFITVQRTTKGDLNIVTDEFWNRHGPYLDLLLGASNRQFTEAMKSLSKADPVEMILMLEFSRRVLLSTTVAGFTYHTPAIQKARDYLRQRNVLYVRFSATDKTKSQSMFDEVMVVPYNDDFYLIRIFSPAPNPHNNSELGAVRDWLTKFRIFQNS